MAQFEKWFTQDLTQNIELRHCESIVFTNDSLSNVVGVNLFVNGVEYSGGGTVTASVVRSDGATVALSGTLDGNKASVTLTSGCFGVPGLIGVYIRLNDGDTKTTVLSAVFTVIQSETESAVDPGTIIPSVQVLIDEIEDAVNSIPADYSQLLASIAPTFSTSTAYAAGVYVWREGVLYRFTAAHPAGSWTGTDATAVVIGDELKAIAGLPMSAGAYFAGLLGANGSYTTNSGKRKTVSGNHVRLEGVGGTSTYAMFNVLGQVGAVSGAYSAANVKKFFENGTCFTTDGRPIFATGYEGILRVAFIKRSERETPQEWEWGYGLYTYNADTDTLTQGYHGYNGQATQNGILIIDQPLSAEFIQVVRDNGTLALVIYAKTNAHNTGNSLDLCWEIIPVAPTT
jgi:hypothetical protein